MFLYPQWWLKKHIHVVISCFSSYLFYLFQPHWSLLLLCFCNAFLVLFLHLFYFLFTTITTLLFLCIQFFFKNSCHSSMLAWLWLRSIFHACVGVYVCMDAGMCMSVDVVCVPVCPCRNVQILIIHIWIYFYMYLHIYFDNNSWTKKY